MRILKKILKALGALLVVARRPRRLPAVVDLPEAPGHRRLRARGRGRDVQVHRHPGGRVLSPEEVDGYARKLLAEMTLQQKVLQMSGDTSLWDMIKLITVEKGKYNDAPITAGADTRLAIPPIGFSDGPRGVVLNHSTAFPVAMARGASWDRELAEAGRGRDREGDPGPGRHSLGRRLRQPPAPPVVGPRAGDARRGPVPPRGAGGGVGRGGAGPQGDGLREALRAQHDRGDADEGGRARRRADAARGVPAALRAPGRGRRRLLHERLQQGERRLRRREPAPPARDPEGGVGLPRLRDVRLLHGGLRREEGGARRARPRDALDQSLRQDARRRGREGRGAAGRDRRGGPAPAAAQDRVRDTPRPDRLPRDTRPGERARRPSRGRSPRRASSC